MLYADNCCKCEEVFKPHRDIFTGPCMKTGEQTSVTVPAEELYAYRQGNLIQEALKSVSRDDREFLMSGYSAKGWALMFPK